MFSKGSHSRRELYEGRHRFEHWYRDNSVYFITARCRSRTDAFENQTCKDIFWQQCEVYTAMFGFIPIVVSLMSNHYHLLGYLKTGQNLGAMMQRLHGSVAKLVNDQVSERLEPFWIDTGHQNCFDGCIRDAIQFRRAYRYTLTQCSRHGVCSNPAQDSHIRAYIELDRAERRALQLNSFSSNVPYARYDRRRQKP